MMSETRLFNLITMAGTGLIFSRRKALTDAIISLVAKSELSRGEQQASAQLAGEPRTLRELADAIVEELEAAQTKWGNDDWVWISAAKHIVRKNLIGENYNEPERTSRPQNAREALAKYVLDGIEEYYKGDLPLVALLDGLKSAALKGAR